MPINASSIVWDDLGKSYLDIIKDAANTYGVPEDLAVNIHVLGEKWRPTANVSPKGATGSMLLMTDTFQEAAKELGLQNPNINNPEHNIHTGVYYLSKQLKRFDGNPILAVAAYNAGPGAVQKAGGVPNFKETKNYVKNVLGTDKSQPIAASNEIIPVKSFGMRVET